MANLNVGERVYHSLRKEGGLVEAVSQRGVHVLFDSRTSRGDPSIGIFDANWFKTHPGVLTRVLDQQGLLDADGKVRR